MKRLIATLALVLALTGCAQQQYDADNADAKHEAHLAKLCVAAGGTYRHDDWNGYYCDYAARP